MPSESQQHDDVVVVVEEKSCRASPSRNSSMEEERGRPGFGVFGVAAPPAPSPLYIGGEVGLGGPPAHLGLGPAAKWGEGDFFPPQVDPP